MILWLWESVIWHNRARQKNNNIIKCIKDSRYEQNDIHFTYKIYVRTTNSSTIIEGVSSLKKVMLTFLLFAKSTFPFPICASFKVTKFLIYVIGSDTCK